MAPRLTPRLLPGCAAQRGDKVNSALSRRGDSVKKLDNDAFVNMRSGASVLEADSYGDKVLLLADGTIVKLFRRKRWLSSAAWYPYAKRFADNAASLHRLGIRVPQILDLFRIPSIERDAVRYQPLPGRTLREIRREPLDAGIEQELKEAFTRFVVRLHDSGVYFRSLHLGNVVYTPDHEFGLIDISDARIVDRPLRKYERARNLKRLQGIEGESEWVDLTSVVDAHRKRREARV